MDRGVMGGMYLNYNIHYMLKLVNIVNKKKPPGGGFYQLTNALKVSFPAIPSEANP